MWSFLEMCLFSRWTLQVLILMFFPRSHWILRLTIKAFGFQDQDGPLSLDILPFVSNTKRPLSNIWLLKYKQNSFGCFRKKNQNFNLYSSCGILLPVWTPDNISSLISVNIFLSGGQNFSFEEVSFQYFHPFKSTRR